MTGTIAARLNELGIALPSPAAPAANYIPYTLSGSVLFLSGQIPLGADGPEYVGKIGREIGIEEGQAAARLCALNLLAHAAKALGDLDRVARVLKLTGFVNAVPDFAEPHTIVNGASNLIVEVLGENGRHARSAIGVATLPMGACVEVEAILEVR